MNDIGNTIKEIYSKKGYLDKYGGSVFLTGLAFFIFFILFSYFYVMNNLKPIKADWNNQRCSPSVIPFAGIINKPDNMSTFDFTGKNFSGCVNNILLTISKNFFKPITYVISLIGNLTNELVKNVQSIREKIAGMVKNLESIDNQIMTRIFNFLMPIQYIFIKLKDIFRKTQGILVTSIFSVINGYFAIKSFIGAFLEIMIGILVIIVGIIVPLMLFFFTWPLAVPGLTAFGIISAFLLTIIIGLSNVVDMTDRSLPPKPGFSRCFDENTEILLKNGKVKTIKNIEINDILEDGSYVTAKFKLSASGVNMYNYKNIIVSGSHKVLINGIQTKIEQLKNVYYINDYRKQYIYCLNTSNKEIKIKNEIFCDWDEINSNLLDKIKNKLGDKLSPLFNQNNIHSILEGGFDKSTELELIDGRSKNINDIEVGHVLKNGDTVWGIVEISTKDISVNKYNLDNKTIISAPNNQICDEDIGYFSTLEVNDYETFNKKPEKLYHILTDSKKVLINGIFFYDYNGCLDAITNN